MPPRRVALLLLVWWWLPASHAQRPRPSVVTTRWPPSLSAYVPHNLTLVVSGPALRPRFQLLSSPPRTLFPLSAAAASPSGVALTFRLPPLPPSQPPWQLRVVHNNSDILLTHPVNKRLTIVPPPMISSAHPRVLHPFQTSLVLLTGRFPPNPRVFIANRRVPPRRIPSTSPTEIIVRVRPSLAYSQLTIFVLAADAVPSPVFNISVRQNLISISASPLHASYSYAAAHYILSSLCANATAVVHFQPHTLSNAQLPVFNVSYRTSAMSPASFIPLREFSSSTVLSLPDRIFSEQHPSKSVVTVVITCAHAGRVGQTLVFISQRRSARVFGISVYPHLHHTLPLHTTAVLRASLSLTHCSNTVNTAVQLIWRVNNTIVQPLQNSSAPLHTISRPATTGLGNTLVVPREGRFVYLVQAVLQHTVTRKVLARAAATGVAVVRNNAPPFKAVLNGAASAITLSPEIKGFPIRVLVYERSQYGVLIASRARYMFQWSCTMSLDSVNSACTSQLFSPWLATESSQASSFQISTVGVEAGTRVEYSVLVYNEFSAAQRLKLILNVGTLEDGLVFPSDAKLTPSPQSFRSRDASDDPVFQCFEPITLSWNQKGSDQLDFKLFREGQSVDILADTAKELVVSHEGYWTRKRPYGRFFAISAAYLDAGRYVLHGAVNKTAGVGKGTSWRFTVEKCPTLVLSELPLVDGTTNVTVFHAAAYSLPSSENLYAFMLRPDPANAKERSIVSDASESDAYNLSGCLDGCTGKRAVSFTVARAGQYRIIAQMYDASGTHLLGSQSSNSTITVTDGEQAEIQEWSSSVGEALNSSLLHRDESRFVDTLLSTQNSKASIDTAVVNVVSGALKQMALNPVVNVLQCRQFVEGCIRMLEFEGLNMTRLEGMLSIINVAVNHSVSSGSSGYHIRQAVVDFYSTAMKVMRKLYQMRGGADAEGDEEVKKMADRARKWAAQTIPLVLSAGSACGEVDHERVYVKDIVGLKENGEQGAVEAFDEYRIGVSCFEGQIKRLTPKPATVETCGEERESKRADEESVSVLWSVEQHDVLEKRVEWEALGGPQIEVRLYEQVEHGGRMSLVPVSGGSGGCYRTRVSVYASSAVSETFSDAEESRVTCSDAGTVREVVQREQDDVRVAAEEFEWDAERRRVSAMVEGQLPVRLKLEVNGTRLGECVRLRASGGAANGKRGAGWVAIWATVGVVGLCALLAMVALAWRWKRGARGARADWDTWESDVGGVGGGRSRSSSSIGGGGGCGVGLAMRLAARGARGETGSIRGLDERASGGSSLLTATVSRTTCSI